MKTIKFFLTLSIFLLPSLAFAGTAYYVDCSAGNNGNGSYANPWNNILSVNSKSFNKGDDVYFKVNTTCTLTSDSDRLQVDWGGTSADRAIIGAYYGDGKFGLNGNSRPIIDGNSDGNEVNGGEYPGSYQGVIEVYSESTDYITIQDLKIQYSGGLGIEVNFADNINVDNCYVYRTTQDGIIYGGGAGGGVQVGVISNNVVENVGYPDYSGTGASITLTGANTEGYTEEITITGNTVLASKQEGIGLYKAITDSIVEYNTVYDIRTAHIYIDAGKRNIIRYNLVYKSTSYPFSSTTYGISINNETLRRYCWSGDNEVYGNLVAGHRIGINLGCEITSCTDVGVPYAKCPGDFSDYNCHSGTKIYNNTLVDNLYNFRNWNPSSDDSIEIKNNISWTITGGTAHAHNYSPAGVTWSHNLFDDSVTGKAATNAVIGDPALKKSSGWRSLTADSLDGTEFSLLSGSKAIDAGISIPSYNDRMAASNFAGDPITVTTITDSKPNIGAWMETMNVRKMGTGITAPKGFKKLPSMTSPTPGSMLLGSSQTFNWSANGTSVTEWWLWIGTSTESYDIYNSESLGTAKSHTVSALPTDGSTLYVRLWYKIAGSWSSSDYTYTALTTRRKLSGLNLFCPGYLPCGNAGGLQILCCQGFEVKNYDFTLGAPD